jgi:hypothetical protein
MKLFTYPSVVLGFYKFIFLILTKTDAQTLKWRKLSYHCIVAVKSFSALLQKT